MPDPTLPAIPRAPVAPETIERAAIRYAGRVYAVASMDHVDVARAMRTTGGIGLGVIVNTAEARGYITSAGRFVTLAEAESFRK